MGRSGHILLEAELATCHDFGGHPGSRSVALNITRAWLKGADGRPRDDRLA